MNHIAIHTHKEAARFMCHLLEQEKEWIFSKLEEPKRILRFWERVIQIM
ncbi:MULTISPECIES: hypothetical protein [Solibacillus]|uniref:Uncharacterized protein n=1 Tax=Solibacillus merdavium TaxID=2762218 RepID=A0ABR8XPS6_9BACL|nr:hypothetical protein [Solibacillus merdavium]MBD8033940.1 hypothetical protein [Solibacillus merdavium]